MTGDFEKLREIGIKLNSKWLDEEAYKMIARDSSRDLDGGIPGWISTYTSPKVIQALTAKTATEEIANPVRHGSYGTLSAAFPVVEQSGVVAPYNDYGNDGEGGVTARFARRDAYYFQNVTEWGDLGSAVWGLAQLDRAAQLQTASAKALKTAHNAIWFYGVDNMENYGLLNDPGLYPANVPLTGEKGIDWESKTTRERYNDIRMMVQQLVTQSGGQIRKDDPMVLCMSPEASVYLTDATDFNISVWDMLSKAFTRMRLVIAPEYSTRAGEMLQLIVPEVQGQPAVELGYVELMYGHGIVRELSSYRQKNSGAGFGAVVYQPFAVVSLLGI